MAGVLVDEVLVGELLSIDRLAPGPVAHGEIASLDHETGNNAVEDAALVPEALLPGAERAEILASLGHVVGEQLELDPSERSATGGDVEVDLGHSTNVKICKNEFY